jgi:hypothetical protein
MFRFLWITLAALIAIPGCDNKKGPPPPTPKAAMANVMAATPASDPSLPSAATTVGTAPSDAAPASAAR